MSSIDVLIIGCGPTGLGAAKRIDQLHKQKAFNGTWKLIEANSEAGGLASTGIHYIMIINLKTLQKKDFCLMSVVMSYFRITSISTIVLMKRFQRNLYDIIYTFLILIRIGLIIKEFRMLDSTILGSLIRSRTISQCCLRMTKQRHFLG
jgi:hypothetical protein